MGMILVIFIIVFQVTVVLFAPFFGLSAMGGIDSTVSVNTTSDMISSGTNPFSTFGAIMTFDMPGAEAFSILFIVLDVVCLVIPLIYLIRGVKG